MYHNGHLLCLLLAIVFGFFSGYAYSQHNYDLAIYNLVMACIFIALGGHLKLSFYMDCNESLWVQMLEILKETETILENDINGQKKTQEEQISQTTDQQEEKA